MAKDSVQVRPLRLILEAARRARPDLAAHGNSYLVECGLSLLAGLPFPLTPAERVKRGAKRRGAQLKTRS